MPVRPPCHVRPARAHALGPQRRAKPLTRDDAFTHIKWIENANADITDPDTYVDFQKMLDLTVVNLQGKALGQPVQVTSGPGFEGQPTWSGDSRWLAYTKQLPNNLRAVFVYSLETAQAAAASR